MSKVSIASYAFHGLLNSKMIDVFGYLETVKFRYNLDTADIWNGMIPTIEDGFILKLKTALRERELVLVNLCIDGPHVWEDDPEKRENNRKLALEYLRAADILGAKTVRIDVGVRASEITEEQLEYIATTYSEYAKIGANAGFKVGPENHWGASIVVKNMQQIADAVNHSNYGILLHIGHWEGELAEQGDELMAKTAVHTHVDAKTCQSSESKIRSLYNAGYAGCWGIEHHSGKNEYNEVQHQLGSVNAALGRIHADPDFLPSGGRNILLDRILA